MARNIILIGFAFIHLAAFSCDTQPKTAEQVKALLPTGSKVQVSEIKGVITLTGEADTFAEMSRIVEVVTGLSSMQINNLTVLSDEGKKDLAAQVTKRIDRPGVNVSVVQNHFLLEGDVDSPFDADRAVEISRLFVIAPMQPAVSQTGKRGPATGKMQMPLAYNANRLPTTIVDLLRVKVPAK